MPHPAPTWQAPPTAGSCPCCPRNTVLTLDRQRHRERRQRLAPMFRGEALEAIAPVIRELAARQIEGWPVGTPFAVLPHTRFLTLSVAARLILGVEDQACVQRLERHLRAALRPYSMLSGIDSLAHLGPISPQAAAERCRQAFARGLSEIIRCRPDHRAGDASRALGRLSADEVFALLHAGHETTATALAWAIELLSRAPEAADALARESSGPSRSWLDAVIWDTLRLRPPLVDIVRQPAEAELREILPQIVGRFVLTPVAAAPVSEALRHGSRSSAGRPGRTARTPGRRLGRAPATLRRTAGGQKFERVVQLLLRESDEQRSSTVKLTQAQIAGELGLSRQTVSRILGELERQRLVERRRGRVVIADREQLHRLAVPHAAG